MTTGAHPSAAAPQGDDSVAAVRVLRQFRRVFNTVKSHFREVDKKVGVGGAQIWALSIVRAYPGIGGSGLARALDVRQPTASNLLRSLLAAPRAGRAGRGGLQRTPARSTTWPLIEVLGADASSAGIPLGQP